MGEVLPIGIPAITRAALVPVAHLLFRPAVDGRENVPRTGPVILAANHLSFIDSLIIPLMAPRVVSFMAKAEYFRRGRLTRPLFTGLHAIPVERAGYRSAQDSLETALELLKSGGAFGIHPEGSRSRDGRLYRGKTGVGWLAIASGAPVVPVAVIGTDRVQPVGAAFPKPFKIRVRFGAPLTFIQSGGARARREATDEVMAAIQRLSGQEPAGVYNEPAGSPKE
jgi:1-acyl-sn-glycerol-3-phosphate acyltransferase